MTPLRPVAGALLFVGLILALLQLLYGARLFRFFFALGVILVCLLVGLTIDLRCGTFFVCGVLSLILGVMLARWLRNVAVVFWSVMCAFEVAAVVAESFGAPASVIITAGILGCVAMLFLSLRYNQHVLVIMTSYQGAQGILAICVAAVLVWGIKLPWAAREIAHDGLLSMLMAGLIAVPGVLFQLRSQTRSEPVTKPTQKRRPRARRFPHPTAG